MKKKQIKKGEDKTKEKTRAQVRKPSPVPKIKKEQAEGFSYEVLNSPFQNLSDEDRENFILETGSKAAGKYKESLNKFKDIAKQHYPLSLLSILASYAAMGGLINCPLIPGKIK